jgi:hypothetical protein
MDLPFKIFKKRKKVVLFPFLKQVLARERAHRNKIKLSCLTDALLFLIRFVLFTKYFCASYECKPQVESLVLFCQVRCTGFHSELL